MSTKSKLHILGYGEWLIHAKTSALRLDRWASVDETVLKKINEYSYDLKDFQEHDPYSEYFLALDGDAFGTVREKHLSDLVSRGFKFASLIPEIFGKKINSLISPSVILPNINLSIGYNTFIGPYSIIGSNNSFAKSVTIGAYTKFYDNIKVENNVTLTDGVQILSGINIVSYCSIQKKMEITKNIYEKTIYSNLFENGVRITENF